MADSCLDILNGVDNHAYYKANLMIFFCLVSPTMIILTELWLLTVLRISVLGHERCSCDMDVLLIRYLAKQLLSLLDIFFVFTISLCDFTCRHSLIDKLNPKGLLVFHIGVQCIFLLSICCFNALLNRFKHQLPKFYSDNQKLQLRDANWVIHPAHVQLDHSATIGILIQGDGTAGALNFKDLRTMRMKMIIKIHLLLMNEVQNSGREDARDGQEPGPPSLLHQRPIQMVGALKMIQKSAKKTEEYLLVLFGTLKCLLGAGLVPGVTHGMAMLVVAAVRVPKALACPSWLNISGAQRKKTMRYRRVCCSFCLSYEQVHG